MKSNQAKSDQFVIIMAGGKGERFWPVSREKSPKQLITLLGKRSFLQQAVDRVLPVVPPENIFIITNAVQAAACRRQLPKLPAANIVAEPVGRDTCAAVALGAAVVRARSATGVMAVMPADHVIPDAKHFQRTLADCFAVAAASRVIVTIGINPTEPATGYGYIEMARPLAGAKGQTPFHQVKRFVEKPNHAKAVAYLASKRFRWNAGMFIWSGETILAEFRQHNPEMADAVERWGAAAKSPAKLRRALEAEYPAITKISIDFALLEKAKNVVMAEGNFAWDDLGAWTALERHIAKDAKGNASNTTCLEVDSERNIIFDSRTKNRTPVTLLGVKDSIIVFTNDVTLVAAKGDSQRIKELVKAVASHPKLKKLA